MIFNSQDLLDHLQQHGAQIHTRFFSLQPIENAGWGLVAACDVPAETDLFHIPTPLVLSPTTSDLRHHLSPSEIDSLDHGWTLLILSMMWEMSRGDASPWAAYLRNMPDSFSTPMFWSDEDLRELFGTDIENRIGKSDAEAEYRDGLEPFLKDRPDLFPADSPFFSLESFHIQGSRILSRSFTVPSGDDNESDDSDGATQAVMIPMADMLNAAHDRDNARLFNDSTGYTMRTSKAISKGEEIFNTYDSPPNSELVRKYGHVDVFSLAGVDDAWPFGNPADEVDIPGSLIVQAVGESPSTAEKVDLWLEEGEEDTFAATLTPEIDPGMISFTRLLLYEDEWRRFKTKGKLPRPTLDPHVALTLDRAVGLRLARYQYPIEDDYRILSTTPPVTSPRYLGAVVRVGEKRILLRLQETLQAVPSPPSKRIKRA